MIDRAVDTDAARQAYAWLQRRERTLRKLLPLGYRGKIIALRGHDLRKYALIDPNFSFLYTVIPKCANTTIKRILWRLQGVEVDSSKAQSVIHIGPGPYYGFHDLSWLRLKNVLTSPNTFRFTFVRNPYERLQSAFRQKILSPHPHENIKIYTDSTRWKKSTLPNFEEFIIRVCRQSDVDMNMHWAPQTQCAMIDIMRYDFIGKVETFQPDINTVLRAIGGDPQFLLRNEKQNQTDPAISDTRYTKSMADIVHDRFRRDFEYFGYSKCSYDSLS